MARNKKSFTFYADDDICEYLEDIEPGMRGKTINKLLRVLVATKKPSGSSAVEFRLHLLEGRVWHLENIAGVQKVEISGKT